MMEASTVNKFASIEAKWQKYWNENSVYKVDLQKAKNPFYNLMMFPYPSAEGLHIGSMFTFTGIDTFGRYKKMKGFDVFEPIGLDAFGIHSENYALKIGEHIKSVSKRTHKHFTEQFHQMGNMHDWSAFLETSSPEYYKWTQWLFSQFFKAGLAYRKEANVKYCPSCKTVVSDEQVIDDRCERCSTKVESKPLEQWFFKITKYADRLYENLKKIDWVDDVKLGQKNWIGKKEGINITYKVKDSDAFVTCFTTRPDTNFGATFIVIAPEHELVNSIIKGNYIVKKSVIEEIKTYVEESTSRSDQERIALGKEKTGVFTGLYAINNLNNKELPIYISDFVLGHFGTGAVVGVPGHDTRDFEFAKKFNLPIIRVVSENGRTSPIEKIEDVQEDDGIMINSDFLNGLNIKDATVKIMDHIEENRWGKRIINYNLRDWCVSRQRYWGPPIPLIFCKECASKGLSWFNTDNSASKNIEKDELNELIDTMKGWFPDENLPVELPDIEDFEKIKPDGSGRGPLSRESSFVNVDCPHCGKSAFRETDVSDPFVDSCWYFLRFPFTEFDNVPFGGNFKNKKSLFDPQITKDKQEELIQRMKKWGPVSSYIGGKEHTVLHLLYARFITMVFHDLGYLDFEEPFKKFIGHGLITKDGAKMSKSKGNIVNPDEFIGKFGADSVRMYLRFIGPFDSSGDWRDSGMFGMAKFVNKVNKIFVNFSKEKDSNISTNKDQDISMIHKTVKMVGDDLEELKFNTAVARIMEFVNWYSDVQVTLDYKTKKDCLTNFALILAPFMPFLAEEFWALLGYEPSIHNEKWPSYDESKLVTDKFRMPIQINGRLRSVVLIDKGLDQNEVQKIAEKDPKIHAYLSTAKVLKVIFVKDKIINFIIK